jgi:hypothetical protein
MCLERLEGGLFLHSLWKNCGKAEIRVQIWTYVRVIAGRADTHVVCVKLAPAAKCVSIF